MIQRLIDRFWDWVAGNTRCKVCGKESARTLSTSSDDSPDLCFDHGGFHSERKDCDCTICRETRG